MKAVPRATIMIGATLIRIDRLLLSDRAAIAPSGIARPLWPVRFVSTPHAA